MRTALPFSLAALVFVTTAPATAGVELANGPATGSISPFGLPDSQTYGQTFTAPITGKLSSFTLWLNGGVGALVGAVGTWNGASTFGFGSGSPTTLYTSSTTAAPSAGAYTFAPNVNVTAGQNYVAYLSVFGVPGASGNTTMQTSNNNVGGINYFVWNNGSAPAGNPSWNYFANAGDARFAASFDAAVSPTPEPEAWASMVLGLGLAGWVARRRKAKLAAAI